MKIPMSFKFLMSSEFMIYEDSDVIQISGVIGIYDI
jgi:hypothetical protein